MIAGILLSGSTSSRNAQSSEQEYLLKATFLYRFADYVEWNTSNEEDVFTIAVVGESGIVAPLNDISKNKKIKNKRILIKQYMNIKEVEPCQIIFIAASHIPATEPFIVPLNNQQALIITESDEDFKNGGHINFLILESKLKFEVNLKAVSASGLKISSQLLEHAYNLTP